MALHVLVVGSGAAGSLITYSLNVAGIRPTLVYRTKPRTTKLKTPGGVVELEATYTTWPELDGYWDYVVVTTKVYDSLNAIDSLRRLSFGLAVFVQNGLGALEAAEDALGSSRVAQLVLNHGIYYDEESNEFVWVGGARSYLGMRRMTRPELYIVAEHLRALDVVVVDDIEPYRWLKLAVNASINALTAVLGVPNGYLVKIPELLEIVRRVAGEVSEVAHAFGVALPADPAQEALQVAEKTGGNLSSTLIDIRKCRRTEIDFINGAVVRIGRKLGVATPYNELLYALVKSLERVCSGV